VESGHVARLMKQWLLRVDAQRPPFTVEHAELEASVTLAGHALALRIDRVDRLADGRRAIVDYKTGRAVTADHWLAERPQAPQLALYALALGDEPAVAALAYAQLKPGQVAAVGLADDPATWPGLPAAGALRRARVADWDEARVTMRDALAKLAQDLHDGDAGIRPRDAKVCGRCAFLSLCRRADVEEADAADGDAE
jgi:RecB family exonuclease